MNKFITSSKLERNSSTKVPLSFARCCRFSAKYGALYIGSSTTSYLGPSCFSSSTGAYINNNNSKSWNQPIKPWLIMNKCHVVSVGPSPPTTSRHKANAPRPPPMSTQSWVEIDEQTLISIGKNINMYFSFFLSFCNYKHENFWAIYYLPWNMLKWWNIVVGGPSARCCPLHHMFPRC